MWSDLVKPTPRRIEIALTGMCNASCVYCAYADKMTEADDLPTEAWLDFFAECEECKVMYVSLSGGEVFMRSDLFRLIEEIVRRKMRFSMLTNGALVTEDKIRWLMGTGRLDAIQTSIDGSRPEVHDQTRGAGAFDYAVRALKIMISLGAPVVVRTTVSPANVDDLYNTSCMLADLGVKRISFNEVNPFGAARDKRSELEMTPEQYVRAMKGILRFDSENPGIASSTAGPQYTARWLQRVRHVLQTGEAMPLRTGYLCGCNCVFSSLSVLHTGQYAPCDHLLDMELGYIGTDRLIDVWKNNPTLNSLRQRIDTPLDEISRCKGCEYQRLCNGGCPAAARAATGRLDEVDPGKCYRQLMERGIANAV